jgi:cell division protein FtsB
LVKNFQKPLLKFTLRALILGVVLWVLGSVIFTKNGVWKQQTLESDNIELQKRIDSLKLLINQTQDDIHKLQNDTFYLEEIARTRYGYTKKGERVFIIKEKKD